MTTEQDKNIHVLYKRLGETPFECVQRFKRNNSLFRGVPMTYAGRLDPMAEGLLLVLSGEEINNKESYLGLPKTYEFEILWEFETDTLDILGMPKGDEISIFPTMEKIQNTTSEFVGKFEQKYPAFSSQPVVGPSDNGGEISQPLIQWAREGKINLIKIPSHEVEMQNIEYVSRKFITGKELLDTILFRISLVNGDFRQEQISTKWKKYLSLQSEKQYAIDIIKVDVSSGFYVRQFVADLAEKLGSPALTFHIKRTKVGDYKLE